MLGTFIKELSNHHQIIIISHLPQIASIAHKHYKIEKTNVVDKTVINLHELDFEHRKIEIARMLSGDITETALIHAEEMLSDNNK
jgi:DNA repair protein RecN (Recombination protein N)